MALVGPVIGVVSVAIDFCDIAFAGGKKVEFERNGPFLFIPHSAHIPILSVAFFTRDRDIIADFGIQDTGILPVGGDVADEFHRLGVFGIIFRRICNHLYGRIDNHIERKLLGDRRQNIAVVASLQAEDAGREVHGPFQHAGEHHIGLMLRRIFAGPGIIFHATHPFTRHPVRIGAMQARALYRFVAVDPDLILCSRLNDADLVIDHPLALMPFAVFLAVRIFALHLGRIGYITGFDDHIIVVGRKFECLVELLFIMRRGAAGLMVSDKADAFFLAIGNQHVDIEISGWLGKVHIIAITEPVAVPAHIPTLDEQVGDLVGCSKINVAFHIFVGGTMLGTACPAPFAFDHVPPDARKFARLDPADVAQFVRFIQVEHQMAVVNSGGVIRDDQGTPWRRPCSLFLDLRLARPGVECGAKRRTFGSRDCHSRVID